MELEPRLCDYNGKLYCRRCHWNDEMIIPSRLIQNWDIERRFVCRASKQLLTVLKCKPVINLSKENPHLFKYISVLSRMEYLRKSIILMKCYFISCKVCIFYFLF